MSLTPTHDGALKVTCDECGHSENMGAQRGLDVIKWLKKNGWESAARSGGGFDDICPECAAQGDDTHD